MKEDWRTECVSSLLKFAFRSKRVLGLVLSISLSVLHINLPWIISMNLTNRGKSQALVRATPFCGEYPGPRFEDKVRSANQMDRISIAGGGKMADS